MMLRQLVSWPAVLLRRSPPARRALLRGIITAALVAVVLGGVSYSRSVALSDSASATDNSRSFAGVAPVGRLGGRSALTLLTHDSRDASRAEALQRAVANVLGVQLFSQPPPDSAPAGGARSALPAEARYLFGVPTNGPNNQYYSFITHIKVAAILNRTLVLPPFKDHTSHAGWKSNVFPFEGTFDVARLAAMQGSPPLIGMGDFASAFAASGASVDAMWVPVPASHLADKPAESDAYWAFYRDLFFGGKHARHVVPATCEDNVPPGGECRVDWTPQGINATFGGDDAHWQVLVLNGRSDANYQIMRGTLLHRGLPFRDTHLRIVRGLVHAPVLMRRADRFLADAGVTGTLEAPASGRRHGPRFFAIHWRRADYERVGRLANCTTYLKCVDAIAIGDLLNVLDSVVLSAVSAGYDDAPQWPVFVAAVRFSEEEAATFAKRGYPRILRYSMPQSELSAEGAPSAEDDPYYGSLVEQEICMRAAGFIGSYSTWSERILEMRVASPSTQFTWHAPTAFTGILSRGQRLGVDEATMDWEPLRPSNVSQYLCGYEYMGISDEPPRIMSLACPKGRTVSRVVFASFGWPSGLCGTFAINKKYHSPRSVEHVAQLCVGKPRCDIAVHNGPDHFAYNHVTNETGHALAVLLECGVGLLGED